VTEADRVVFLPKRLNQGWRLACQARAQSPLVLECSQTRMEVLTDNVGLASAGKHGLGIAIDLAPQLLPPKRSTSPRARCWRWKRS